MNAKISCCLPVTLFILSFYKLPTTEENGHQVNIVYSPSCDTAPVIHIMIVRLTTFCLFHLPLLNVVAPRLSSSATIWPKPFLEQPAMWLNEHSMSFSFTEQVHALKRINPYDLSSGTTTRSNLTVLVLH